MILCAPHRVCSGRTPAEGCVLCERDRLYVDLEAAKVQIGDLRRGLGQAKQYIAHDTIAHAMRKKDDGEYELSFDPGCRRCCLDNLLVVYPPATEEKCCDSLTIVKVRHEPNCPVEGQADESGFPTAQQLKIHRAVEDFSGACKAHGMTDCRICVPIRHCLDGKSGCTSGSMSCSCSCRACSEIRR